PFRQDCVASERPRRPECDHGIETSDGVRIPTELTDPRHFRRRRFFLKLTGIGSIAAPVGARVSPVRRSRPDPTSLALVPKHPGRWSKVGRSNRQIVRWWSSVIAGKTVVMTRCQAGESRWAGAAKRFDRATGSLPPRGPA